MSAIELRGITKNFGDAKVVYPTDLQVEHGELVTLLGPSGSGKSTILSMIAGLLTPSSGQILIDGKDVTHTPPARRNLGMVFQSYALFPHLTVFDNVAFPLSIRKLAKADIEKKVMRALEMVRLDGLAKRKQTQLSGGQQQRVALARALVFEPDILLLDEPLGALDKKLREEVQLELRQLQRNLGVTTIMVTHDQEEALSLSTRLVVLDAGQVQQVATPQQAYKQPASKFVAEFIGTANLWQGQVSYTASQVSVQPLLTLQTGEQLPCPAGTENHNNAYLLVRPEQLQVVAADCSDCPSGIAATVTETVYLGQTTRMHLQTANCHPLVAVVDGMQPFTEGQSVSVSWAPESAWVFPA